MVDEEKEPGVYVRSNRPEQELDFLWDRERRKSAEHERFHIGFFAGGAVVGSLVTLAICLFVFLGPKLSPAMTTATPLDKPTEKATVVEDKSADTNKVAPEKAVAAAAVKTPGAALAPIGSPSSASPPTTKFALHWPFFSGPKPAEKMPTPAAATPSKQYQVQPGDTLGSIAHKFYASSGPKWVGKIQQANHLTNADTLGLGQKLVIPPKD